MVVHCVQADEMLMIAPRRVVIAPITLHRRQSSAANERSVPKTFVDCDHKYLGDGYSDPIAEPNAGLSRAKAYRENSTLQAGAVEA